MFRVRIDGALKQAGYQPTFVEDGERALAEAGGGPEVILLDLNFAQIDPLGLIARLKADPATQHIHLLGYVAHVHSDLIAEARRCGCDQVVARSALLTSIAKLGAPGTEAGMIDNGGT